MTSNMVRHAYKRTYAPSAVVIICLLLLFITAIVGPATLTKGAEPTPTHTPTFNYGEALQQAIYFYEEQSSGPKASLPIHVLMSKTVSLGQSSTISVG